MYNYEKERPWVFTDEGQRDLLKVRDKTFNLLKLAGAVRSQEMITGLTGSDWQHLALVDRLVELGDIREIQQQGGCAGQHRIFVRRGD
jgi:hypothetical protein